MDLLLPGNLPTHLCESETTDGLTVALFCDIHINKGATLNLLQCLCVYLFLPRSFFNFAFPRMQRCVAKNKVRNILIELTQVSSKHGEEGKVLLLLLQYQQTVLWLLSAAQR